MATISWEEALMLSRDGGVVEMRFSCSDGRGGRAGNDGNGWSGHYEGRPTVTGRILKVGEDLQFPNGQIVKRDDFDWMGDGEDGEIDMFSEDPDDYDCCCVEVTIVASRGSLRKEQLKDMYASVIKKVRLLGFTDDDWKDANNKADD